MIMALLFYALNILKTAGNLISTAYAACNE